MSSKEQVVEKERLIDFIKRKSKSNSTNNSFDFFSFIFKSKHFIHICIAFIIIMVVYLLVNIIGLIFKSLSNILSDVLSITDGQSLINFISSQSTFTLWLFFVVIPVIFVWLFASTRRF
jgi:hypothetical protein